MKKKELELENEILTELAQQLGDSLIVAIGKAQELRSLAKSQNKLIAAQNKLIGELRSELNSQEASE